MFEVYAHTSPSGKTYVGWTSRGYERRWVDHVREAKYRNRTAIAKAIRKYGPGAFTHALLERVSTEAAAKRAEVLWIRELNTFTPGGYNMTSGGDGAPQMSMTPEARQKIGDALRGVPRAPEAVERTAAGLRGKPKSSQHRARISAALRTPDIRAKLSRGGRATRPAAVLTGRLHALENFLAGLVAAGRSAAAHSCRFRARKLAEKLGCATPRWAAKVRRRG